MAISARIAQKGADLVLIDVRNRTAEYLRKKSEKKVYPGKTVKIEYWALKNNGHIVLRSREKGTVEWNSKAIFGVKINGHIECFRHNELLGNEYIKVRV